MSLKKTLKIKQAQAVVEYIVTFIVLAISAIAVFGAFSPEHINIGSTFKQAVNGAIQEINR